MRIVIKKVVRIIFIVGYVLVASEYFLRIFAPAAMVPRYVCETPYGIRGNMPKRSYWHTTPDVHINIRTNSKGIRADKEIPYQKAAGLKRIVILGDSYGMGYEVDLKDMFTTQMENELIKAGINCEVVNLSVSGHGNAEQLIYLQKEGLKYHPDLVLLAWHGSDLGDNVRSNLFKLENDNLIRANPTYLPGVHIREVLDRYAIYRWAAAHSHLYSFIREWSAGQIKSILFSIQSKAPQEKPSSSEEKEIPSKDNYPQKLCLALLQEINKECASAGAKFLVLDIPSWRSRTKFVSRFPSYESNTVQQFLVFSPIETFKEHSGELIYWEHSHFHFTPLGCRLVGEGLAKLILKHKLLGK